MLYLTRKIGESIVINDNIEVTVVEVRGKAIKLGFTFPPEVSVLRREIHQRIKEEHRAAAAGTADPPMDVDPASGERAARAGVTGSAREETGG